MHLRWVCGMRSCGMSTQGCLCMCPEALRTGATAQCSADMFPTEEMSLFLVNMSICKGRG
jgi:hypothetical protein